MVPFSNIREQNGIDTPQPFMLKSLTQVQCLEPSLTQLINFKGHALDGTEYVLAIVDRYSRFVHTDKLQSKPQAIQVIIDCIKMWNPKFSDRFNLEEIRANNGTEYVNK